MLDRVFAPGTIGRLTLPHRIVMGSMHLGIEDGPGEPLAAFYAARARGGAGLIITGGSAVSRVGAGGRLYGFVNEPAEHDKLAAVAGAVHEAGGLIALQLFHAGRYAFADAFGLQPVAPSAVPSRFSPDPPAALDAGGIAATIADFASGARTAAALGFDAVELMGSEGYLLNQFCSPLTNLRDDEWGGDALRRMAFPLAVVAAVRPAGGGSFPVIYRMSGADLMPGSTSPAETLELARALAAAGVDALNIGIGWHESAVPTVQAVVPGGAWVAEALALRRAAAGVPVISGNRVNRLTTAERILAAGAADFVSMARPFLADPELIRAGRAGRGVNVCIGCNQACIDRSLADAAVSCLVNPDAGHELDRPRPGGERPAGPPGRFAVIGGGPAGLAAARSLAGEGHAVVLFEAEDELGGQFRLARLVPGKGDYGGTIRYYAGELQRLGVDVRLGARIRPGNVDPLLAAGFDGVVLATGVHPRAVELDGCDLPHVLSYPQAFGRAAALAGPVAIIGGGGIAVDLAHLLSADPGDADPGRFRAVHGIGGGAIPGLVDGWPELDHLAAPAARPACAPKASPQVPPQVTIMRRSGKIGSGIGRSTRWVLIAELRRARVRMLTGVSYRRIVPHGVQIDTGDGPQSIDAATVVIAAGQVPNDELALPLARSGVPFRVVGGARDTDGLDAVRAFAEGLTAARELARLAAASGMHRRRAAP